MAVHYKLIAYTPVSFYNPELARIRGSLSMCIIMVDNTVADPKNFEWKLNILYGKLKSQNG